MRITVFGYMRRTHLWALWLIWLIVLLAVYYQRLWQLFLEGPVTWVKENHSLAAAAALRHLIVPGPLSHSFPAFGEAMGRGLTAIWGVGLVLIAAFALGFGICRLLLWQPDDWREGLLYRTSLGLGAVSYLSLGLALFGLYYSPYLKTLIVATALGGGSWLLFTWVSSDSSWNKVKALVGPGLHLPRIMSDRIWLAIIALALLIAFIGALAPEIEYDALWYHLWLPKVWMEQGRPVDVVAEFISLYPLTWELIFNAGVVFGGPIAGKLLHFASMLLTALLVFQSVRRFVPRGSPWLAVAFFVTIPTVVWEATTANVDLALTMHVGLVIYALLRYVEEQSRAWFALAVINLGLAIATKHLGLFVLAITTTGLMVHLWLKHRDLRRAFLPPLILVLLSLIFPLPWYLRSWFASGNPVFPDFYTLFGAFPPERWSEISERGWRNFEAQFGRHPRTLLTQLSLFWDMTVHASWYDGTFGPLFLLILPALALLRPISRAISWLLAFVLIYIGLWAMPFNGLELRFLMPLTPILAVIAAEVCGQLSVRLPRQLMRVFEVGLAVLLMLNLPPFTSLHEVDRIMWDGWLVNVVHEVPLSVVLGSEYQEDYLSRKVPSYSAWRYINTRLPSDVLVLTFSGGDHFYSERKRLWSDSTMAHPATWGAPRGYEDKALASLARLGVSHVLFDKQQIETLSPDTFAIAQPIVLNNWHIEYEDSHFILYQVRNIDRGNSS